jgi:hypothetical protein
MQDGDGASLGILNVMLQQTIVGGTVCCMIWYGMFAIRMRAKEFMLCHVVSL